MSRTLFFGVGLSLLMNVAGAQVRDVPAATDRHGGFGLPDQRGRRLLVIPKLAQPERLKAALCSGRRASVQFERTQAAGANSDGRQTSRTFDALAGNVFTVVEHNPVEPDTPCFLASEAFVTGSEVLTIVAPEGSAACRQPERFATLRDRPVINCWPLARLGLAAHVALLEFERRGKDALASVVLIDGARMMFADVPAEFRGPGEDLWRVDDGGVLSPHGITLVCALKRGRWHALATAWAGAEGRSLSLWIAERSDRFTKVINDYWYQAPR
jgi:hypothetical protein